MEVTSMTDNLAKAIASGSKLAFESVFLSYFPKVKRFISGLLQDENIAEDLAQDIFVKIWQNRSDLVNIENLNAYFYQAARNIAYQHIRKQLLIRKYRENHQEYMINNNLILNEEQEEKIYANQLKAFIQATINRMPPQRKKIYEMSRLQGKKNDEIAQELAISKRTVENHLTQALADIRQTIKKLYIFL